MFQKTVIWNAKNDIGSNMKPDPRQQQVSKEVPYYSSHCVSERIC